MSEKLGNVWVFIEQEAGKIADVSLELVCKGRELADQLGVELEAVLLGDNVADKADVLYSYGCDSVILAEDSPPGTIHSSAVCQSHYGFNQTL